MHGEAEQIQEEKKMSVYRVVENRRREESLYLICTLSEKVW